MASPDGEDGSSGDPPAGPGLACSFPKGKPSNGHCKGVAVTLHMISGELTGNGLAARPGDGLLSRRVDLGPTASRGSAKPCCLICLDR